MHPEEPLKWLRGPLPPLSESILASGLVRGDGIINPPVKSEPYVLPSPPSHQHSPKKSKFVPPPVEKSRRAETSLAVSSQPVSQPADIPSYYKPLPIEVQAKLPRRKNKSKPEISDPPYLGVSKGANVRDETKQIAEELESSIAEHMGSISPQPTSEEQQRFRQRMMQIHTFAFNKLITAEKTNCSERALLMRKIQQFYVRMHSDYPSIIDNLVEEKQKLMIENQELSSKLQIAEGMSTQTKDDNSDMIRKLDEQKEEIERLKKINNEKDIQLTLMEDDLETEKKRVFFLTRDLNTQKEGILSLNEVLEKREEESKRQIEEIEQLNSTIQQFQKGETGFIAKYVEEKKKVEELQEKICSLEAGIQRLTTIPKDDKCVDTSDLPIKKKSKKANSGEQNSSIRLSGHISSETSFSKLPDSARNKRLLKSGSNTSLLPSNSFLSLTKSAGTQTDLDMTPMQSNDLKITENPPEKDSSIVSTDKNEVNTEIDSLDTKPTLEEKRHQNETVVEIDDDDSQKLIVDRNFDDPPNFVYDNDAVLQLPDLFDSLAPLFSRPYILPTSQPFIKLNQYEAHHNIKGDRSFVWGVQLIQNFLTDPFLRSKEAADTNNNEMVFVSWMMKQFKLPHLVNQLLGEFSIVLYKYKGQDPMVALFFEVLESRYNSEQLCFMSFVHSFSTQFLEPSLLTMLQNPDLTPEHDIITIHIKYATWILAKCFSMDIADTFMRGKILRNDPMINYFDFLRQATYFFGDKHRQISYTSRDLLAMCGSPDTKIITFRTFSKFFTFLEPKTDKKYLWKMLSNRVGEGETETTDLQTIFQLCADRRKPYIDLINLSSVSKSLTILQQLQPIISELYQELLDRFTTIIPKVVTLSGHQSSTKLDQEMDLLRKSILEVNLPLIIWNYKLVLIRLEKMILKSQGFIPFDYAATSQQITMLIEYINRSESVTFALLPDTR